MTGVNLMRDARDNGGIPVPHEKVFTRTHRTNKGKGPFVDDKSKKAFEIYTSKLKEKQSDQSYLLTTQGSCIYYPELWVEASGGPKNGRCYGFGSIWFGSGKQMNLRGCSVSTRPLEKPPKSSVWSGFEAGIRHGNK
ncbi:hypothetical protein KSP40_PGU011165 [Platanthera guangdongensis]|uniref:Uncharacterized protein n=1 Tax=Platanthera guangdongensis TaxID=2320717 RepID=A0ABR2N475_9ASPA